MFFCVLSNCFSRGKADDSLGAGKREGKPLEQSRREMVKAWSREGVMAMERKMSSQETLRRKDPLDLTSCGWSIKTKGCKGEE